MLPREIDNPALGDWKGQKSADRSDRGDHSDGKRIIEDYPAHGMQAETRWAGRRGQRGQWFLGCLEGDGRFLERYWKGIGKFLR